MKCPRCTSATLDERDRDGVIIDACPDCRGIWLDRGELEKILSRATLEAEEVERLRSSRPYREHDDDDYEDRYRGSHPRKRSWSRTLSDLFD